MKLLKNFKAPLLAIAVAGVFTACSSDDDNTQDLENGKGQLGIFAAASYSPTADKNNLAGNSVIELSKFAVNIDEIELEYDDIIDEDSFYNSDDDIELKGPFELNLLTAEPVEIVTVELPNGRLEEIEFEFDKNELSESDLYNQSIRMEGTLDGVPFVFWHDFEEELELEFDEDDSPQGQIYNDQNGIVINFDLTAILDPTSGVDLSTAVDRNGDGLIEISPNDTDGNQDLAEAMKETIKNQIDLFD
ncbi:hypothetical protein [Aequorivita marina]|uniref:hypothetical protein n=1 Tax=Aequorivita marina TaxID=3073654 RepID=UPI0028766B82|nr:hypothetical protein [Aequorivita sp. S2608]MDS1299646.1 hypothetical protein [Aequorivita sp. S2608]